MVLLIGKIIYIPQQKFYVIELSDGWYSLFLVVFNNMKENPKNLFYSNNNALLLDLVSRNKLFSGLKVHVFGLERSPYQNLAEFFGPSFDLFEPSEKTLVNLYYNNVCRAKWDEKLGLKKNCYLLRNLNCVRPGGGFLSLVDVFVVRKYPLLERKNNKTSYFEGISNEFSENIPKKNVFFKISVMDALVFECKNNGFVQQNLVEIGFFNMGAELYDLISEGDRLRISNLKADDRDKLLKKRFDFIKNEIVEKKVYLEMTKFSKIVFFRDMKLNSAEKKGMNNFGREICRKMRRSISNISNNNEVISKFRREKYENKKLTNELDCLMYVVSMDLKTKNMICGKDSENNELRLKVFRFFLL